VITVPVLALCDAVSTRENVLNILGAGISRLSRASFPAPFYAEFAIQIQVFPEAEPSMKEVVFQVRGVEGEDVGIPELRFEVAIPSETHAPGASELIPFQLDARDLGLPHAGTYEATVQVDSKVLNRITFVAVQMDDLEDADLVAGV
jgi:hypothetical protein